MSQSNRNIMGIFLLTCLFSLINFSASYRAIQWDHQNMDEIPNMPKEVPVDGPVQFYQIGHGGRTEYMYAQVEKKHIKTGTDTNAASRNLGGDRGDDAGHVLASKLGGLGQNENRNLIPQNPSCNRGAWKSFVEDVVAKEVEKYGKTDYRVKMLYRTSTDTRPYEIIGQVKLHNGQNNFYTNELANPPSNQKCGE